MFHKSFSKKDLIEILEILDIEIEDVQDYDKKQLVSHFQQWIDEHPKGLFLPNVLFLDTVSQLTTYLTSINQSKINTAQTRQMIMNKAKKLNAYCKNGCMLSDATYNCVEDIIEDVKIILSFGDSPSVRKAVYGVNNDPKIKEKFFPVISEKCKAKIEEKKKIRKAQMGQAQVKHGHFVITFD